MSKEEFVRWEDLDLDFYLGDYTDEGEIFFDLQDVHVEEEEEAEQVIPCKKSKMDKSLKKTSSQIFVCPICSKNYTSISGFRGHVIKKHNRPDIKAHQHREGFQAQGQSSEDIPMKEAFPKADLRAAIEAALTVALSLMVSCPLLNSEKSKHGKGILQVAKEVIQEEIATHIILPLEGILVTLCTGRFSSCDIERAFTQFHSLRLSLDLPLTSNCDPKHKRMFGQMLLRKVFAEAINSIKTGLARANKDPEEVVLTAHDKSVLFYISGYIVKKITPRVPSLQLTCTTLPTSFVKESADWLALVNRGGLKIPRDDFFFLIQELERRHRTFADRKSLSANSLNVVALKEYMMESHLVNFYSERLGCNSYLEAIISIFLTVRGFAITKQLRNKSNSDKKSLRKGLKNKGKNTKAQLH